MHSESVLWVEILSINERNSENQKETSHQYTVDTWRQ